MSVVKTEPIRLEVGKFYHIKTPNSNNFRSNKIHIDSIIKSPCYSPQDDWIEDSEDLYVYRIWSQKRGWKWFVVPFWELCLWNDWNYKK